MPVHRLYLGFGGAGSPGGGAVMNLSRQFDYIEAELRGQMRLSELLGLVEKARELLAEPQATIRCHWCNLKVVSEEKAMQRRMYPHAEQGLKRVK